MRRVSTCLQACVMFSSRLRKNAGTDESVPNRKCGISKMRVRAVDRSVCPRVFPQPAKWRYPKHMGYKWLLVLWLPIFAAGADSQRYIVELSGDPVAEH